MKTYRFAFAVSYSVIGIASSGIAAEQISQSYTPKTKSEIVLEISRGIICNKHIMNVARIVRSHDWYDASTDYIKTIKVNGSPVTLTLNRKLNDKENPNSGMVSSLQIIGYGRKVDAEYPVSNPEIGKLMNCASERKVSDEKATGELEKLLGFLDKRVRAGKRSTE